MAQYKRISSGKPPLRWTVVDGYGKLINKNPNRDELKGLDKFPERHGKSKPKYTDEQLLYRLRRFYEKYGKSPTQKDFTNNHECPAFSTYIRQFGSWPNALKLVGLDVDSMTKRGVLITNQQKARSDEIKVISHFRQHPIDLAGKNCNSPCDGVCPNGKTYDVKGSKLYKHTNGKGYWAYHTNNKYKEEIEIYYLIARDDDGTTVHIWRIPGEIVEKDMFYVWTCGGEFNVGNMEEYDIIGKFKYILDDIQK